MRHRSTNSPIKLTRITSLRPSHGDAYYLCIILQHIPAIDWIQWRTVDNVVHDSYQSAAFAFGFVDSASEGHLAFKEAVESLQIPAQLHFLFTELISDGTPALG